MTRPRRCDIVHLVARQQTYIVHRRRTVFQFEGVFPTADVSIQLPKFARVVYKLGQFLEDGTFKYMVEWDEF